MHVEVYFCLLRPWEREPGVTVNGKLRWLQSKKKKKKSGGQSLFFVLHSFTLHSLVHQYMVSTHLSRAGTASLRIKVLCSLYSLLETLPETSNANTNSPFFSHRLTWRQQYCPRMENTTLVPHVPPKKMWQGMSHTGFRESLLSRFLWRTKYDASAVILDRLLDCDRD